MTSSQQLIQRLLTLNPGRLTVIKGTRHWKVRANGHQICILPFNFSQEGLARNTKSALRRAGLRY